MGFPEVTKDVLSSAYTPVIAITVFGLPIAILLVGWVGSQVLGFPLLVSLLFATIVYPVDLVSVIRIFREVDAPPRLAALVESESHLGDGFTIVVVHDGTALTDVLGAFADGPRAKFSAAAN